MQISRITNKNNHYNANFCGLFERKDVVIRALGKSYHNKTFYKIYNFVYHPFKDEAAEVIRKTIDKNRKGQYFLLIETDHFHREGEYYFLNNIRLGSSIDRSLKNESYIRMPDGVGSAQHIYNSYNNHSYGVMDYTELSINRVKQALKEFKKIFKR